MKLPFYQIAFLVDNTQILQKEGGVLVKDLKDEPGFHIRMEILHSSVHKCRQNRGLFQAYGDDGLLCGDDSKRNGHIPVLSTALLDRRNIHQNQGVIIFHLDTGPFFLIQRCPNVIRINSVGLRNFQNFCGSWIG